MDPKDQRNKEMHDDSLERDLLAIREVLSDHQDQEPPALLDQAVLNTARRELNTGKRAPLRWIGAFATASVLVLAVTIVVQQERPALEQTEQFNGRDRDQIGESRAVRQEKAQASRAIDDLERSDDSRAKEGSGQREAEPADDTPLKRKQEPGLKKAAEQVPAAAPPPPVADAGFRDDPISAAGQEMDAPENPALLESAVSEEYEEAALAAQSRRDNDPDQNDARPVEEASELDEAVNSAELKKDTSETWVRDPEAWVERLLELQQDRQLQQLQQELEDFQSLYPDFPLPPELASQG